MIIVNDIFVEDSAGCPVEQHDVNVVVVFRLLFGAKMFERPALHQI